MAATKTRDTRRRTAAPTTPRGRRVRCSECGQLRAPAAKAKAPKPLRLACMFAGCKRKAGGMLVLDDGGHTAVCTQHVLLLDSDDGRALAYEHTLPQDAGLCWSSLWAYYSGGLRLAPAAP